MHTSLRYFLYLIRSNKANGTGLNQLKYYSRWKASLRDGASSVKDEQPWITFDVIELLKKELKPASRVFEYGGGGSTLFFVKRALEVVTVEHDKEWFGLLSDMVQKQKRNNWKGCFILPEKGVLVEHPDKAVPEHYASGDQASEGMNYRNYVCHIDQFPEGYFDVVLVDGRSRASCIQHSIAKIKKGGLLVLDNSERTYYCDKQIDTIQANFYKVIDHYGASPYSQSFTKTSVWRKK